MAAPRRIGVIGLTHDHVWSNLEQLVACEDAQLVGAADPHAELTAQAAERFGCPAFESLPELIDQAAPQAVYVFGDNAGSVHYAMQAMDAGLDVLIEKPMAADLAGADKLLATARQRGRRLMINWPFAWWPQLQHALSMAVDGTLGHVWQVRYRAAHAGPKELGCSSYFCEWLFDPHRNGAGALMDYCCYGSVLAAYVLGLPSRVTAIAGRLCKEEMTVEDNALLVMSYPRAIATAEGSWTQIGKLTSYTTAIYGSLGTLLVEPRADGRLLWATEAEPEGVLVEVPTALPHLSSASRNFLWALETGEPFYELCRDRVCRDAQEILQAGVLSTRAGSEISLPLKI